MVILGVLGSQRYIYLCIIFQIVKYLNVSFDFNLLVTCDDFLNIIDNESEL